MLDNHGFDLWSGDYDKSVNASDGNGSYPFAGYKKLMNTIYGTVMKRSPAKVLDIGIGTGTLSSKLYEQGNDITGIDFSKEMLEKATLKMPDAKLIQCDFSKGLPEELNSTTFDFIISTYALHHLADDEKIDFITSLLAILNENGTIIIGDVSFQTRNDLESCKESSGEDWDDNEFYYVFSEIEERLNDKCALTYHQFSHCSGIMEIQPNVNPNLDNYTEINAKTIDRWIDAGWEWGVPVSAEACANARRGEWDVVLTPIKPVPKDWFPPLKDIKLLGLASGGGQQMPIFSTLGANCTVMDLSDKQLESERFVSSREGYVINIVKADMTQRFPFEDCSFDLIFHPVSNCYVEDVCHVWRECYRVLRRGGILLAGMDNGFNFLFDSYEKPLVISNCLPFNPLKNPEQMKKLAGGDDGIQFSHTFDEQIGGQLKAGFVITGAYEDFNNDTDASADGIPAYWATKALKP